MVIGTVIVIPVSSPDAEFTHRTIEIPIEAVASWSVLLGYDDPGEALAAILHVQEYGEPDPDPETGDNAWTAPYKALVGREHALLRERLERAQGTPPAARAMAAPETAGDDVAAAQAQARQALGLPQGPAPVDEVTTFRAAALPQVVAGRESHTNPVDDAIAQLRGPLAQDVAAQRAQFVQGLAVGISTQGGTDGNPG